MSGFAWLYVFVPAVAYFLATRLAIGREFGEKLDEGSCIQETTASHNFAPLTGCWYRVATRTKPRSGWIDATWRHDEELGRGYLLLASEDDNRVWRWEVGGGPIAIGTTLYMDQAGCRSKKECSSSSSLSLTVEPRSNSVVIAEGGEQRIVRVEEATGARTPLVPWTPCSVRELAFTPSSGDLWIVTAAPPHQQENMACDKTQIYQITGVAKTPPLASLQESRRAHYVPRNESSLDSWISLRGPEIGVVGGIAANATALFFSALLVETGKPALLQVRLEPDEDDDEEDFQQQATVLTTFSDFVPGPVALAHQDGVTLVVIAIGHQLWVFNTGTGRKTSVDLPIENRVVVHSLTVGGDGYLYATWGTSLYRIRMAKGVSQVRLLSSKRQHVDSAWSWS